MAYEAEWVKELSHEEKLALLLALLKNFEHLIESGAGA